MNSFVEHKVRNCPSRRICMTRSQAHLLLSSWFTPLGMWKFRKWGAAAVFHSESIAQALKLRSDETLTARFFQMLLAFCPRKGRLVGRSFWRCIEPASTVAGLAYCNGSLASLSVYWYLDPNSGTAAQ